MLKIGTSGYSYRDWLGAFYPDGTETKDFLSYYSKYFDAVEINSTYYRTPSARMFEEMVKKVPSTFKLAVKTPSTFTHERSRYAGSLRPFRECLEPLVRKGLLGCLLAQFPHSFRPSASGFDYLRRMAEDLEVVAPLCIEFRHSSWQSDEVYTFLKKNNIGYVNVDLPRLELLPKPSSITTSREIGYIRLHGRVEEERWWRPAQPFERYNYIYREEELEEWLPIVRKVQSSSEDLYVFFNNHYSGKSVKAALDMKRLLGFKVEQEPPQLRERQQQLS